MIVITALLLRPGERGRYPSGVGDRNATHVEVVDQISQPPQRVVALEIELFKNTSKVTREST